MVTDDKRIKYLEDYASHQAATFNIYADAMSKVITLLADIRNCEVCTLRGNGHCEIHVIGEQLQDVAVSINTVKQMLDSSPKFE